MRKHIYPVIIAYILYIMGATSLFSQSEGGRVAFGFNYGLNKYWGEFSDNQFWFSGDLFLRYNIISWMSVNGSFNLGLTRYKTDDEVLNRYSAYFGNGEQGDLYPGMDNVHIRDKNSVRWIASDLTVSINIFPSQTFIPYVFGGLGYLNWEPKAGDTGYEGALPNNSKEVYKKSMITFPVGLGFEQYLTDDLVLNGKGMFRLGMNDYYDDLSPAEDPNANSDADQLLSFGLGFSYYILGDVDYDDDGLSNDTEKKIGSDPNNPDSDGDALPDGDEVKRYYTNPLKQDTDEDKLTDSEELLQSNTSPSNPDTDADGLIDSEELVRKSDPLNPDTDNDRLIDGDEVNKYETNAIEMDTDGDGLNDGEEVLKLSTDPKAIDSDKDGLKDGDEVLVYKTNPANSDSDADGLADGLEINTHKTDPLNVDSDGDLLTDGSEVSESLTNPLNSDSDNDGLSDGDEVKKFKTNPLMSDSDTDGLTDKDETGNYKTDPLKNDSDGDGLKDGEEVMKYKTDPLLADTDKDGLNDNEELVKYLTNPNKTDTDNDKLTDGIEVTKTNTDPNNPDTDGDKIIDSEDDCALVYGELSQKKGRNGCPQPPKIGTKTDFPDILFIVNTDNFNFDDHGTSRNLAKLLEYVRQCAGLQVLIEGHASEEGKKDRNQKLSDMRAKKVQKWLIEQGVSPSVIFGAIGYGTSQPKVKEPTGNALKQMAKQDLEAIRKQNRRITVVIKKTCDD